VTRLHRTIVGAVTSARLTGAVANVRDLFKVLLPWVF
jgi:hypothetical protein